MSVSIVRITRSSCTPQGVNADTWTTFQNYSAGARYRDCHTITRPTVPLRGSGEPLLPGGYEVGEKVFFTGASQTLSNGDKVMHGQQGKATGPAIFRAHPSTQGCTVRFPGNKGNINCDLTMVPPPRRRHCYPPPDPYTRDADRSRLCQPRRPSPDCQRSRPTAQEPGGWLWEAWCARRVALQWQRQRGCWL